GPTGSQGPGFNSYLNGVITINQPLILVGSTIIYDAVNIVGPDFSYNPITGYFTINTTGVYVFQWKVAITPYPLTLAIQIDLEKVPGPIFIGGISIPVTHPTVTGSQIIYAATAGDTLRFANNSNGSVSLVLTGLLGPIATVSAFRIV
ncbi:MAG: hypothetical protein MUO60_05410, partial [Clostridiaceae bacterium]|nr:hypothetical protein [Clostridiaceae bacterium]